MPPRELRTLVGTTDERNFDNPGGDPIFPDLDDEALSYVLDWGSGCGRLARMLIQQETPPARYLGIDIHREMVEWCRSNLTPVAPSFTFEHHDVYNPGLNPDGARTPLPFPVEDGEISLVVAWSVFTHVNQPFAEHYLDEVARVLRPDGRARTSWFLFDKDGFPMMQEEQNVLFISDIDPTNAVIFDRRWLLEQLDRRGLVLTNVEPPAIRGFQWHLEFRPRSGNETHVEIPPDEAPAGIARPPKHGGDDPDVRHGVRQSESTD